MNFKSEIKVNGKSHTELNIMSNNAMIAEFMGWNTFDEGKTFEVPNLYPVYNIDDKENSGWIQEKVNDLQFHERWDYLMPVIERISLLAFDDQSEETAYPRTFGMLNVHTVEFSFRFNRYTLFTEKKLIDAAYKAVVDFIEKL